MRKLELTNTGQPSYGWPVCHSMRVLGLMTNSVQSLERAFCLLELLGAADHAVAISDLARMSGLPLGTVHRLLDTLVQLQYVEHDPLSRRYALGPRILHLRAPTLDKHNLGMQAMPVMKALM